MDLKGLLKSQGYTDEQIQAVLSAMKENGIYASSVENPDETIKKLQEDNEQLKAAKNDSQKPSEGDASAGELIKQLQDEVRRSRLETAAIIGLTRAGAVDVDYLMYKAEKSGELQKLKLDENGNVAGADELVGSLKKNYAAQFAETSGQPATPVRTGIKKLEEAAAADEEPQTLEEAIALKLSGENE